MKNSNYNNHKNNNYKNNNYKKNNSGINMADLSNQLHQHLANRAVLEQEQDRLWNRVHNGYNCTYEMNRVDEKIGNNTYAIDGIIGKLIKAGWRSGRAYSMAVDYLKKEIARNQRIIASWEEKIRSVKRGDSWWIHPDGSHSCDCTSAYKYVAKKKRKVAETQRRLSQLL
jgi:hypothetical protein